jgi:hypothetical protein
MESKLSGILRFIDPQHPKNSTPPNLYYWSILKTRRFSKFGDFSII